eukprot:CAMPEP_0171183258 /NCGR_PEP_ID=MMETSP0790-20130122/15187_1 /TAXON_ID=2925 /ORGANISM="Alexandrium catenella, Strain OF101" /LENGTH=1052 /DNA_ID=CAMNT_0011648231 /DNA_START=75 /DNA_END=3230 /DNA_ORIENTATION=+
MNVDEEIVEETTEEWMRLLEGYDNDDTKNGSKEPAMEVGDDDDDGENLENVKVADEGDATALLAAVKQRLASSGRASQYHEFLTAISQATVDREAAMAILRGHPDLILAFRRCFSEVDDGTGVIQDSLEDRRGPNARASQLVQLVFTNALKAGHEFEQSKMLEYVKRKSAEGAFPRRLVIIRGPPGTGKSHWAMEQLRKEDVMAAGLGQAEAMGVQLAHVCSTDDFFMQFSGKSVGEMQYIFNACNVDASNLMNEARVRLAMEVGIEPLYVDNTNMKLFDMRPYVMLADRMGYVVSVVSPGEINAKWSDVDFLQSRNLEKHRRTTDEYVGRSALEAMIDGFEQLPDASDLRPAIRAAQRPAEEDSKFGGLSSEFATKLPPSAILYKLEKLLKEESDILRYTPPDGDGWGVNGELNGEWHSFREKSDGSCYYDDRLNWWTEDPEGTWTLDELAMLADLRAEAQELPEAELPTVTSHPSLFATKGKRPAAGAARVSALPAQSTAAGAAKQVSRAGAWQTAPGGAAPAAVPASRAERFKARMKIQREHEAHEAEVFEGAVAAPPAKRARANTGRRVSAEVPDVEDVDEAVPGLPTEQEEVSASTFLAAVKARLVEWGKVEQYHEFILALSGTVDAKAAVRILRGHDDLLRVFKRKFAPEADLMAIKAELKEEDPDLPHPPAHPPTGGVKQELGAKTVKTAAAATPYTPSSYRVKSEAGHDGPRPPAGAPAKQELGGKVKAEVKSEDMPRPPKLPPNVQRGTVTIGDDSDEEFHTEASIGAAVRKGRDECIAQLSKVIFRRERASHEGARPRMAMVRYATKVASRPRFPRELFVLRGPPGIGKSEYAMQQLADYVAVEPDETLAARLTHVCAADDFFEHFQGDDAMYKFEASKLDRYHNRNESRVRLAMEAGIHPLYVDCTNFRLWEMRPYVILAERLGYVVTVVEPGDICQKWDDVNFLASANDTSDRQARGKVVQRPLLTAMVKALQPVSVDDAVQAIKDAKREDGHRTVEAVPLPPAMKPVGKVGVQRPAAPGAKGARPGYNPYAQGKGAAKW